MFDKLLREIKKMESMQVSIPIEADEDGYLDKECPSEECLFQFKIKEEDWKGKDSICYCPLCGHEASGDSFWTTEQLEHGKQEAVKHVKSKFNKALRDSAKGFNRKQPKGGFFTMKMQVKGGSSHSFILPIPAQKELEQKITCSQCQTNYSVLGSAFFCPSCGHNSAIETFDNSMKKIESKISNIDRIREAVAEVSPDDAERTVRSLIETGLSDGVVAFQRYCEVSYRKYCSPNKKIKFNAFQNLEFGAQYWKELLDETYSDWLIETEMSMLNILFQKRHLLAHAEGIVDEKYISKSGDSKYSVGQRIVIKENDILTLVSLIKKIIDKIKTKLEDLKSTREDKVE